MKISKKQLRSSTHTIPDIRFESQSLTSFSGLVLFQALFGRLDMRSRLRGCVGHCRSSSSYGHGKILLTLLVHVILGWRRLSDIRFYAHDPLVKRVVGLTQIPHVSTLSRALSAMDSGVVVRLRSLVRELVLSRILSSRIATLTMDFDGTVLSTKSRRTEGTAVGFNRKAKGQRSYYPLMATIAQTGQIFDLHHRPGNVHDSNGACEFIKVCVHRI